MAHMTEGGPGCPHFPFPKQDILPDGQTSFPPGHDPLSLPAVLTELEPVSKVIMPGGDTAYLVTGYAECLQVLRDTDAFERGGADGIPPFPPTAPTLLALDGQEHRRIRELARNTFSPTRILHLRPVVESIAAPLIQDILDDPGPVEIHTRLGMPLTLGVIGHILNVPDEDLPRFAVWGDAFLSTNPDRVADNRAAMEQMTAYMAAQIELISASGTHGTSTDLLAEIAANASLTAVPMDQAVVFAATLVIAGWETTAGAVSSFLYRLLTTNSDDGNRLYDQLCAHPDRIPGAIEELLRTVPSGTLHASQPRRAIRDVYLGQTLVRQGEVVIPSTDAANRDQRKFRAPDRIDFQRADSAHLRFGAGPHVCIGAHLARLELAVLLERLSMHAPAARLHQTAHDVVWNSVTTIRRPKELWLNLRPESPSRAAAPRTSGPEPTLG